MASVDAVMVGSRLANDRTLTNGTWMVSDGRMMNGKRMASAAGLMTVEGLASEVWVTTGVNHGERA